MKRIAFVATGYIIKHDGISVYIENILLEFLKELKENDLPYRIDIYTGKSALNLLLKRMSSEDLLNDNINFISINDKNFFTKIADLNIKLITKGKYDVVFMPNFMPTILIPNTIKVIHDFSVNNFPELFTKTFLKYHNSILWYAKKFDKAIGYISDATLIDLEKFHNINKKNKPLYYFPNGIPFKVQNYERPDEQNINIKYENKNLEFIVVGMINKHKGFDRILEFFQYFDKDEENKLFESITLNIVGKQTKDTTQLFKDLKLQNINLVFHGFINDQELNQLYTKSHFCFFLSRNEGYGIPLVEAMWFKSFPIISNIPIFKEIMGNRYPMFDDTTGYAKSIKEFILKIFNDAAYRKEERILLEQIVENERQGYNIAAKNLINYIREENE